MADRARLPFQIGISLVRVLALRPAAVQFTLDKAMAAAGGWAPLGPRLWPYGSRRGDRDAGRTRPHGLPRMVAVTVG
ncbi:hypothetical protein [Mesorhizobium delmotii]|uniref:Uncharacterized protein n=1 Tax=Mesorhizobium delmotii TaxID=1631247 RepID=A0A2P9AM93_9HYPH|nr:hypothetical protein [Mesorhizobium delmotii]SJM32234.1 hypothetical protein BQ8482_250119 [Mesorhizobium delmotii]